MSMLPDRLVFAEGLALLVILGKWISSAAAILSSTSSMLGLKMGQRLTFALNWYRATLLADMHGWSQNLITSVPTMYVWADRDSTIMGAGARACGDYVKSEYRFEIMRGVSHWMLDDAPSAVGDLLLDWFAAHPAQPSGG